MDESFIGLRNYLTTSPGIGGYIKKDPEEFVVEEIPKLPKSADSGKYLFIKVWSRDRDTFDVIRSIAKNFKIGFNEVGYLGIKDRRAITTQYMAVPAENLEICLRDIEIQPICRTNTKIKVGMLIGNKFDIILRGAKGRVDEINEEINERGFQNFYGPQRFGYRFNNHIIGKLLIKGDFEGAILELLGDPAPHERALSSTLNVLVVPLIFIDPVALVPA